MKHNLAITLLGEQLGWSEDEFQTELTYLQLMVDYKYDSYQGFQPASRFYVALLYCLSQFTDIDSRRLFYRFIRKELIFISQREMNHLVSLLMPKIERSMRQSIGAELALPLHEVWTSEAAASRLKLMKRRTLYVGLSDGARVDVFRRFNEGQVTNEQVVATNEISSTKWNDLKKELANDLAAKWPTEKVCFERVCLIDDFAGSGGSFIKKKPNGDWGGKMYRFHEAYKQSALPGLLAEKCVMQVHHHLISKKATDYIAENMAQFALENPQYQPQTTYSYQLPEQVVISEARSEADLVSLIKRCYDKDIEDRHTGPDLWFGYKACGLPLVLEHNTPNNSIALLWASSKSETTPSHLMRGLFARRKRHSSDE